MLMTTSEAVTLENRNAARSVRRTFGHGLDCRIVDALNQPMTTKQIMTVLCIGDMFLPVVRSQLRRLAGAGVIYHTDGCWVRMVERHEQPADTLHRACLRARRDLRARTGFRRH